MVNTRIKELWEASKTVREVESFTEGIFYTQATDNYEKFAALIIKDCINQCNQVWYDTNNDKSYQTENNPRMIGMHHGEKVGALKCMSRINKHFGNE